MRSRRLSAFLTGSPLPAVECEWAMRTGTPARAAARSGKTESALTWEWDDGPPLVREQTLQATPCKRGGARKEEPRTPGRRATRSPRAARAAESSSTRKSNCTRLLVHMPVVVHDHGLDAAAAHLAHNMRYADRLTHLPVLPFPNMIENVLRNTFASIAREAFLT